MSTDDWMNGPKPRPKRGEIFSQARMRQVIGTSPPTMQNLIREGAPVETRGERNESWQINSADFIDWYVARAVAKATGSGATATSLDAAKVRDKEAQARLREIQAALREGQVCEVALVGRFLNRVTGEVRARALGLESQVTGLTEDQREQLQGAVHDMLTGLASMQLELDDHVDFEDEDSEGLEDVQQISDGIAAAPADDPSGLG